jgi:hypothetical protein
VKIEEQQVSVINFDKSEKKKKEKTKVSHFEIIQQVIRHQLKVLVESHGVPVDIFRCVGIFWKKYLLHLYYREEFSAPQNLRHGKKRLKTETGEASKKAESNLFILPPLSLASCFTYLGLFWLRVPMLPSELQGYLSKRFSSLRLVETEKLPYKSGVLKYKAEADVEIADGSRLNFTNRKGPQPSAIAVGAASIAGVIGMEKDLPGVAAWPLVIKKLETLQLPYFQEISLVCLQICLQCNFDCIIDKLVLSPFPDDSILSVEDLGVGIIMVAIKMIWDVTKDDYEDQSNVEFQSFVENVVMPELFEMTLHPMPKIKWTPKVPPEAVLDPEFYGKTVQEMLKAGYDYHGTLHLD